MAKQPNRGSSSKSGRSKTAHSSNWPIIREQLKYIDLLIEVCDARAPLSSRHKKAKEIFSGKPVLLVLNKADLADQKALQVHLRNINQSTDEKAIALSLKTNHNQKAILDLILKLTASRRQALAKKGILSQVVRTCIIGMPNVGKSSLINWLSKQKRARVANIPGVTRGPQWIKLSSQLELLDTPGILPKDSLAAPVKDKLAILNLLTESTYDLESLAEKLLSFMKTQYPAAIMNYLDISNITEISLETLAQKRGFLTAGGQYDFERAARALLTDLRNFKLGGICLDWPE